MKSVAEIPSRQVGPLVVSPIALPDILECAIYGQALKGSE